MRVTDKMIFEGASRNTARTREELETAARETASGVRVKHPWDDPAAASAVVGHRASAARAQAIAEIADRTISELNAGDEALAGMNNVLDRARELAVQFANSTYAPEERRAAATEIQGLISQTTTYANARFGGRYLFAGFKDNAQPFDSAGAYSGDNGVRQVETAPGLYENASIDGQSIFKGTGGGVDIFATLASLSQALTSNDAPAINGLLTNIDASIDQVTQGRARAGTGVSVFETARSAAEVARDADNDAAAKRTDVDVVASASRLAFAQRALEAALTASAKSFDLSLLSKLGR